MKNIILIIIGIATITFGISYASNVKKIDRLTFIPLPTISPSVVKPLIIKPTPHPKPTTRTPPPPAIVEAHNELPIIDNRFEDNLQDRLKSEGLTDEDLARRLADKLKADFRNQGSLYDITDTIRSVLGPDADDVEVETMKQLVLKASADSFDLMVSRGEVTVSQDRFE